MQHATGYAGQVYAASLLQSKKQVPVPVPPLLRQLLRRLHHICFQKPVPGSKAAAVAVTAPATNPQLQSKEACGCTWHSQSCVP